MILTIAPYAYALAALKGVALQALVARVSYTQRTISAPDPQKLLGASDDEPTTPSATWPEVVVNYYYGQLTRGEGAGTRVLIKEYTTTAESSGSEPATDASVERMRARLESLDTIGRLEAALSAESLPSALAISEAMAQAERSAHERLGAQPKFFTKFLGSEETAWDAAAAAPDADAPTIRNVYVWTGERVRMAMPQRAPPTLASYCALRCAGQTAGHFTDRSVPRTATVQRSKFLRAALSDALRGLEALHEANLVHCGISLESIGITQEDDRAGVKGRLENLHFSRDARSLELASRVDEQTGSLLPRYQGRPDPLDTELRRRAERAGALGESGDEGAGRFGRADDMRAFGATMLLAIMVACAPSTSEVDVAELARLLDGPFALDLYESPTDGAVDIEALKEYLVAADELRLESAEANRDGVGGVDLLESGGGWDLVGALLGPWADRPTATEALAHRFWETTCSV